MATNAKAILSQIKVNDELKDLWFRGDYIEVTQDGETMSLTAALEALGTTIGALPTASAVAEQIEAAGHAKMAVVDAVPTADDADDVTIYLIKNADTGYYDMYKRIEVGGAAEVVRLDDTSIDLDNYLQQLAGTADNASEIVVAAADGAGIELSGVKVGGSVLKTDTDAQTVATEAAVAAAIATAVSGIHNVYVGESAPAEMQNGDLFVQIVEDADETV